MPALPDAMLLPVTGAVLLLASMLTAWICVVRLRRAAAHDTAQILVQSECLAGQLQQLQAALAATDARLATFATEFDEHSRRSSVAPSASYNVAIRLARTGASRQELMASCGVTQQEADLLMRLHTREGQVQHAAA